MSKTVLRVGCIGCGERARIYCDGAKDLPEIELLAFCDVRLESADLFKLNYSGKYATSDANKLLNDEEIDAVIICTWHDSHMDLAVSAAQHGKHILIEKPLALTIAECWQIEEAVEKAGVTTTVGFKMRYMPIVRRVQELVPNPIMLMGQMLNDRIPDNSWSLQPRIGGGNVLSGACHTADLLCFLAGSDPIEVFGIGGNAIHRTPDMTDYVMAVVKFANGAVANLVQGDAGRNPYTSTFFCEVMGLSKGACMHDRFHRATLWGCDQAQLGISDLNAEERKDVEGDVALLQDFAKSALAGIPSRAPVRTGRIATTVARKLLDSVRVGMPQQIEADWRSNYG